VFPRAVELKLRLPVEKVTGRLPVPVRLTVCGLVSALSVSVRMPLAEPSVVGVNVTLIVQFPPAATLVPHVVLATAKGPLTAMLAILSATFRRFVTVTAFAALGLPTAKEPKFKLVVDRLTGVLPLPLRPTVCIPPLSVIVTVPDADPKTVGANVTWTVHDAPGASAPMQVLV
jgi:hypothetical protein